MFRNYLVTALRNFARHKLYSFINIAGLTVGLTCAIFIILFVRDQISYDRWIPGTKNLYRIEHTFILPGQPAQPYSRTPYLVPEAMFEHVPEIKARTRLIPNPITVLVKNQQFPEKVDVVDPNFFQVIRLPFSAGDANVALARPESVVISETRARKYFGGAPALGKTITVSAQYCDELNRDCQTKQYVLTVTGVLRDLPHNTQLVADLVMSNKSVADPTEPDAKTNWFHTEGWGYVQLAEGSDPIVATKKFKEWLDKSIDLKKLMNINLPVSEILNTRLTPFIYDHLSTDQFGSMTPAGSWTTVYGFSAIGALILLVACFNFTNLATARATLRAREISLRKVMGATRAQLIIQFLSEALLTAFISLVLALSLTEMLLPLFDRSISTPIQFNYLRDWRLLGIIALTALTAGILSGIYPALILSAFRPINTLRVNASKASGSGLLRVALVVLQFAVSIGLSIAALVVFAQISFARNIELGFQKDGIILISAGELTPEAKQSFVSALASNSNILAAGSSGSQAIPFANSTNNMAVQVPGRPTSEMFRSAVISPTFPKVYEIPLLAGRFLSESHGPDSVSLAQAGVPGAGADHTPYNILVNAAAARRLGFTPKAAVGKNLIIRDTIATIVGVIGDSRIDGAEKPVAATIYLYLPAFSGWVSVRARTDSLSNTLSFIDHTWHGFAPSLVIRRSFISDDFEKQFQTLEKQKTMFALFVGIAIFIACLGLFGLASFSADRRTREIGLRKVFGAGSRDIIWLLLWQFSIPVLIANLIAWPLAYYYLRTWLDGYAYRIGLSPVYFLAAGAAALVIAWSTVFVHASRVARANPIHALRYE